MPSGDPVADEVVRLYGLAPEEFVAARNAAAKACRQAGRKDDAATIAALRRPSVVESAVNRTAQRVPDITAAWAAATRAADDAQSATIGGADAAGLRAAVTALRDATAALVDAAVETIGDASKRDDIAALLRSVPVGAVHQVVAGVLGSAARPEDDLFAGAPAPPARPRPAARATKSRPARAPAAKAAMPKAAMPRAAKPAARPDAPAKPSARERALTTAVERRRAALGELDAERDRVRQAAEAARRELEAVERKHAIATAALADAEQELRAEVAARTG